MKKLAIAFTSIIAAFSVASCNKEVVPEEVQPVKSDIIFNISVSGLTPETRAAKTGWVNGDRLNIWFDGNFEVTPDLVLTYDGSSWKAGNLRNGCELPPGQGKLLAVYENGNDLSGLDPKKDPTYNNSARFSFKSESFKNGNEVHLAYYSRLVAYADQQAYTLANGTLTASIKEWAVPIGIQITVTGLLPEKKYGLKADIPLPQFEVPGSFRVDQYMGGSRLVLGISEQTAAATSSPDGEAVFYFRNYTTVDHDNYKLPLILIPLAENGIHQMFYDATLPTLKGDERYQAFKVNVSKFAKRTINGHEYVDLGLPGGIKWATCNVGASNPEGFGDYYAWGETETYYSQLNPLTWKVGKENGYYESSYTQTNYNITDNKTILEAQDDVASKYFGGTWRMPTKQDWEGLIANCTWSWTNENGVNGMRVTGKNGNSIFLPAAGSYSGTSPGTTVGTKGCYWSSSRVQSPTDRAWSIYFTSSGNTFSDDVRYLGQSIRPVAQ